MESHPDSKWTLAKSMNHFQTRASKLKSGAVLFCTADDKDNQDVLEIPFLKIRFGNTFLKNNSVLLRQFCCSHYLSRDNLVLVPRAVSLQYTLRGLTPRPLLG